MNLSKKTKLKINQAAGAVCEGFAVVCSNAAVNNAKIEQENEAIQANANNQEQNDNTNIAAALFGDPTAGNTQEAELENELEQENEAEINQAAAAVCEGFAVVCSNAAVNNAKIEQENEAIQANANNQEQNDNTNIAAALFGDPDSW